MKNKKLSAIKQVEYYAASKKDTVSLSQGALQIGGIHESIKNYIKELLATETTDHYVHYQGIEALRNTLISYYSIDSANQDVLITHGGTGALNVLFHSILYPISKTNSQTEVLTTTPSYPLYISLAKNYNAQPILYKLSPETNWELDLNTLIQHITNATKIIVLSNPSNPIGCILSQKTLESLADICAQKNIYLILDEAYIDYIYQGNFYSGITLSKKYPTVITVHSFSKSIGISGWRTGYIIANKEYLYQLALTQDTFLSCVNTIGQYAAAYALKNNTIINQNHTYVEKACDIALKTLSPLIEKNILSVHRPAAGFYLFPQIHLNKPICPFSIIDQVGVSIVPGTGFNYDQNFVRICFARKHEIIEKALNRFVDYFI